MSSVTRETPFSGRTAWVRNLETPLRNFMRTETGSAAVLLVAAVGALIWANVDVSSYRHVMHTTIALRIGGTGLSHDVRYWLNSGLMTLFFFVIGLEARREFDMGELRDRRRVALPLAAGLGGSIVPVVIFLALNAGRGSAHGWGVAMSTDTAFALGMLALVGPRFPVRLRAFMLTVSVVDDVVALIVIATVYTSSLHVLALAIAVGIVAVILIAVWLDVHRGMLYAGLGIVGWIALSKSGVDPVVLGLVMGLLTFAAPAARGDLERASDLFRRFREQPTAELARTAKLGLASALSPNERAQQRFHPWTSYVIVPLFALANAGIQINGHFLATAFTSPITLGILVGYVLGKPTGILGGAALVTRVSRGRLRPPVGWVALAGGGTIAGIGFTVPLLIADLAFTGTQLEQAKLGVLTAACCASGLTWLVFRAAALLPRGLRLRALIGTAEVIVDLAVPVDPERDHVRGPAEGPVTIVEYGDFECPYCGRAETAIRELLRHHADIRYVWRNLPLNDVHAHAEFAAEAAEAAALQGAFWEMHDLLLAHQDALTTEDVLGYARSLGLDIDRFTDDLEKHVGAARIAEDVDGADLSNVSGTPTFFINDRRHYGAYDVESLVEAVRAARARALISPGVASA